MGQENLSIYIFGEEVRATVIVANSLEKLIGKNENRSPANWRSVASTERSLEWRTWKFRMFQRLTITSNEETKERLDLMHRENKRLDSKH